MAQMSTKNQSNVALTAAHKIMQHFLCKQFPAGGLTVVRGGTWLTANAIKVPQTWIKQRCYLSRLLYLSQIYLSTQKCQFNSTILALVHSYVVDERKIFSIF